MAKGMGAIDNLLRRWGFVRVDRFGLILTPDDRVVSTRQHVLDDGLGGKIVGWLDGDLAAMELQPWGAPRAAAPAPAPVPRLASVMRVVAPPPPPRVTAPMPVVMAPPPPVVLAPPPAPAIVPPPPVADEPDLEEDEWEWEIAMARVRALAKQEAADRDRDVVTVLEKPEPIAAPEPVARPLAASRPQAVTRPPLKPAPRAHPITRQLHSTGKTVIPVPSLPVASDVTAVRPLTRAPRGTNRVEDTIRTHAASPANEDRTATHVSLPPAANARRASAKQR
jgi:hypothetical protein